MVPAGKNGVHYNYLRHNFSSRLRGLGNLSSHSAGDKTLREVPTNFGLRQHALPQVPEGDGQQPLGEPVPHVPEARGEAGVRMLFPVPQEARRDQDQDMRQVCDADSPGVHAVLFMPH
jgi:hypothetical protein